MTSPVRFLGVALVSLATLALELTLTRLFSATMFYHFAFLAISLALFGSGASGVFLYVLRPRLDRSGRRAPRRLQRALRRRHGGGPAGDPLPPALAGRAGPLDARLARLDLRGRGAALLLLRLRHHARHHRLGPARSAASTSSTSPAPPPGAWCSCRCSALLGAIDTVLLVAVLALAGGLPAQPAPLAPPPPRRGGGAPRLQPRDRADRAPRVQGALGGGGRLLAVELVLAGHGDADGGPRPPAHLHRLRRRHHPLPRRQPTSSGTAASPTAPRGSPTSWAAATRCSSSGPGAGST